MLEGVLNEPVEPDEGLLRKFRKEKQELEDKLRDVRQELDDLRVDKERLERSLRNLRQQLSPLHRGLRAIFGEIELAIGEEQLPASSGHSASEPAVNSRVNAVWETWKTKLRGKQADFIQALLEHGQMTSIQLRIATHSGSSTVAETLGKLQTLGLVEKNGSMYSLKKL
jgi:phage shock protein A